MTARRILLVGHQRSHEVLTAARDLAAAGWGVNVATGARRSLGGASRFVDGERRVHAPDVDRSAFTRDVAAAARDFGAEVVLGCGDPEMLCLSAARDALPATLPLAEHGRVLAAVDKLTLTRAAVHVGLAVPRTEPADDRAVACWHGPAVVKPRLHLDPGHGGASSWVAARFTDSPADLARAVQAVRAAGGAPVLQEPVSGALIAVSAVRTADGRLAALLQQRAVRTWPAEAGVSSRAVTVPVDPALGEGVRDLLDHLGWVGMVQVQFLQPDVGPPRLLDLNGRPYGSLPLASAAGVPLLALWLGPGSGRGGPLEAPTEGPSMASPGATYSRGPADLRRALTERRGGLLRDATSTCAAWWGAAHPVADRHDLRPLLRVLPLAAGELIHVAVRRARASIHGRPATNPAKPELPDAGPDSTRIRVRSRPLPSARRKRS